MRGRRGPILTESTANDPMEFDTCLWDEIQDMPGEIFDFDLDIDDREMMPMDMQEDIEKEDPLLD